MRNKLLCSSFVAAMALLVGTPVIAAPASNYSLDLTLASIHSEAWARRDLNQKNLGIGITRKFSENWAVSGGWYRNSYRRGSVYLLAEWTPWRHVLPGGWSVAGGLVVGLDSGYRSNEIATAPQVAAGLLKVISPAGWALDFTALPNGPHHRSGFLGLQISLPI